MAAHPDEELCSKSNLELNTLQAGYDALLETEPKPNRTLEQKRFNERTVHFKDGKRKIDFIICFEKCRNENNDILEQQGQNLSQISDFTESKKAQARSKFLETIKAAGDYQLECEIEPWKESPDKKTYFIKVHAPFETLLRGAEELHFRLPINKNELRAHPLRERIFEKFGIADPLVATVPEHLEIDDHFTAPFKYKNREKFLYWKRDDRENAFFTTAQRSAITQYILWKTKRSDSSTEVNDGMEELKGLGALLHNGTFSGAYPIHDGPHTVSAEDRDKMTDRQFLYENWAHPRTWWKNQPLFHVRRYFGEKIGIYFAWLGFVTTFLIIAAVAGAFFQIMGLIYTFSDNVIAEEICDETNRQQFYMCPPCDSKCDFWYLTDSCVASQVTLLFDNGSTIIFACFMSLWAVLFLEFWKRKQFKLQFRWSTLGYEEIDETLRPEFEATVEHYLRNVPDHERDKMRGKYTEIDQVTGETILTRPLNRTLLSLSASFGVLCVMVTLVLGVVFSIILYRAGVSGAIYRLLANVPEGSDVSGIAVSITGAVFQLVCILLLNIVYRYLAKKFTDWELHKTQTEYDDSFIVKIYLFQFVNYYSSIFYIAFFKGNFIGYPGSYSRVGGARLEECATYGCFLELSIQYVIIMVGKQILSAVLELGVPVAKRVIRLIRKQKETEDEIYTRWERDFYLVPNPPQGLVGEYLQIVIQYGFVTLFVSTFPLAPLFALINNWVEIRLDAYKFLVLQQRPVADRAQDIGAWYYIMEVMSKLSVITNAWLIGVTANYIPLLVYQGLGYDSVQRMNYPNTTLGFVYWSQSSFSMSVLLNDTVGSSSAFPVPAALRLKVYYNNGTAVKSTATSENLLYLPFVNYTCMEMNGCYSATNGIHGFTMSQWKNLYSNITNTKCRDLLFRVANPNDTTGTAVIKNFVTPNMGGCFNADVTCRFRSQVNESGIQASSRNSAFVNSAFSRPISHYQTLVFRLAFVIVFEHVIFVLGGIIAWLIPDIPKTVRDEIRKEKKLGADAEANS